MGDLGLELGNGLFVAFDGRFLLGRLDPEGLIAAPDDAHPDVIDQHGQQGQTQDDTADTQYFQRFAAEAQGLGTGLRVRDDDDRQMFVSHFDTS